MAKGGYWIYRASGKNYVDATTGTGISTWLEILAR
jgi:hypothetical protein